MPVSRTSAVVLWKDVSSYHQPSQRLFSPDTRHKNLRLFSECRSVGVNREVVLGLDGSTLVDGVTLVISSVNNVFF